MNTLRIASYITLSLLSTFHCTTCLTSSETAWFESKETILFPDNPNIYGRIQVRLYRTYLSVISNSIPDHQVSPNDRQSIVEQEFDEQLPADPEIAPQPTCLKGGSIIGWATNGVAIYSPFDTSGNDASIKEDRCQGQLAPNGVYHYKQLPNGCNTFTPGFQGHDPSWIYGVALDGFPIYGPVDENGNRITNRQLDECHGMETADGGYRYIMNDEWPYVLGCFRGTPAPVTTAQIGFPPCLYSCSNGRASQSCNNIPPVITTLPPLVTGITVSEANMFESQGIIIPGGLYGEVSVNKNDVTGTYILTSNGVPDHNPGNFIDTPITQQSFTLNFPQNPTTSPQPSCLPAQSVIGFATNGVAIFSPFDNNLNNLNINYGNSCQGRTTSGGVYYYARPPTQCLTYTGGYRGHDTSEIYGVALDGFPIYGPGSGYSNYDLDACHGKTVNGRYGYYMNDEWPYILGCFRGTPQFAIGTPGGSLTCKFACNKNAYQDAFTCRDDFVVIPPTVQPQPPTEPPVVTVPPPKPDTGLKDSETYLFISGNFIPVPGSSLNGVVSVIASTDGSDTYTLTSNGIPDHNVGNIPNADHPWPISQQSFTLRFPKDPLDPQINSYAQCLPAQSIIGFARNGVPIFSPFDNSLNNINFDVGSRCQGQTNSNGIYYYARPPDQCTTFTSSNLYGIYGVALDGFPIYGPAWNVPNSQLDACHGKTDSSGRYAYYMNDEWPYILGCFRGTPQYNFLQGSTKSQVCKYACNKESSSNAFFCNDGFLPVNPPLRTPRPPTTTIVPTPPPQPDTGLIDYELNLFTSGNFNPVPGSSLNGAVSVMTSTDGSNTYTLTSNGIPDHNVGNIPNADHPWPISQQSFTLRFPKDPQINSYAQCLPAQSIIGFARNGVPIFSPFDNNLNNINFDFGSQCQGQTNSNGIYYYARPPDQCTTFATGSNLYGIYGVALDGFPIYGPAWNVPNSQLDACHGKTDSSGRYAYYMNDEWPYILGCFRGTPQYNFLQGSTKSQVCKYACNKETSSNIFCNDGFLPVNPPLRTPRPPTTTMVPTPPPQPDTGLIDYELNLFTSGNFNPVPGSSLNGAVSVMTSTDGSNTYTLTSNGIPDHNVGNIPNADHPWPISQQSFTLRFPKDPQINSYAQCLPAQSIIGFARNGVPIFSPFDNSLNNINFDVGSQCQGQTNSGGIYYYARPPNQCTTFATGSNSYGIYGVALDGFPIYGPAWNIPNSQLDACHGKTDFNGRYAYYMNDEWPYILGCFRGTPQYNFLQGSTKSQVCKYACNKESSSNTFFCSDGFLPVNPPLRLPTPTQSGSGLTLNEITEFQSQGIQVIPGSSLYGEVSVSLNQDRTYTFVSNGIPDHNVGPTPSVERPWPISEQSFNFKFPQSPSMNALVSCLPAQSIIGFAINGVAIFSPFDNALNNLNIDFGTNCQGRTSVGGIYYYARTPDQCSTYTNGYRGHDSSGIYGVALDGFPIYGPGTGYSNSQLDACHGTTVNGRYGYYMNDEWPYILGCFRGTPQYDMLQGVPTRSSVCKFACNKNAYPSSITCRDDFTMLLPSPTQPITPPHPPSMSGLTVAERNSFKSQYTNGSVIIYASGQGSASSLLVSNGIPDHSTDDLFVSKAIVEQNYILPIPHDPVYNDIPKCIPANSIIGFATNGVPIFSHFDADLTDQTKDFGNKCQGRVDSEGRYYFSQLPDKCETFDTDFGGRDPNSIYGVALDGFPIYGPGEGDSKITNEELDVCHGKLLETGQYRYYMTEEFPYIIGCFRGDPQIITQGAPPTSDVCEFVCDGVIINEGTGEKISCKTSKEPTVDKDKTLLGVKDEEFSAFGSRQVYEPITKTVGITQILEEENSIIFVSNGVPDHATGQWAGLSAQDYVVRLPKRPEVIDDPECLPSPGIIGFTTNGVAIFSPYDAEGNDVNDVADDDYDLCKGSVESSGIYYYTHIPVCLDNDPNGIFGVALDGFPIYGPGNPPVRNEDLDVCHGREVDGQYRYYMTEEFPYIMGCFRGVPQEMARHMDRPTVPPFDDSCRYACNVNGTTVESERAFCRASSHFLSIWLMILSVFSILISRL